MMLLKNRRELVELFEKNKYKTGAEIGVREGLYSKYILENSTVEKLVLVDPWTLNKELGYPEKSWKIFLENISDHQNRIEIVKNVSIDAAKEYLDGSFDFVYIDALHDYDSVKQDINLWYPKVKSGGILSGHDYEKTICPGVVKAVDEFILDNRYELHLADSKSPDTIIEHDGFSKSWFIIKK